MSTRNCLAIVLAAGEGTRMRSAMPKVMHAVGGRPMLGHVLSTVRGCGATRVAVVVGPDASEVTAFAKKEVPDAAIYVQTDRLGTAHAALAARKEFSKSPDDVIVVYGDTPLLTSATLRRLRNALAKGADVVVLGFHSPTPHGYGRLIMDQDRLVAIREEKDADRLERMIEFCNSGVMGFRGGIAPLLKKIGNANAKGEYYLTDLVAIANQAGMRVAALEGDETEFLGVNSRVELAAAERAFQERARWAAMAAGVTLVAPETVWFSHDTRIGRDVVIEPNVFFGPGVTVGEGAVIRANTYVDGAKVGPGAIVGPFARLRPGADIRVGAHVGNFVEVKNARIGEGAKANHLAYIGDATIGAAVNVGAGTITCNYDGFDKHRTVVGDRAFIGSNSALVAPVRIGADAYIATGSVITADVPQDAMAVARGRQETKPGWAAKLRDKKRSPQQKRS
jgi:bifunctional UDP-N-acetylglucosamine pyrophosphorylase / glucosamine-1-phosphate N-acetyltransferase